MLSRIAVLNRPLRSSGVDGSNIFSPARCMNIEYGLCECCAASRVPPPTLARKRIGKVALAAEHVVDLARLIDDLVHRDEGERDLPPIHDRPKARARRADGDAGQGRLGDRRGVDALARRTP